jgi:hypothetical protein
VTTEMFGKGEQKKDRSETSDTTRRPHRQERGFRSVPGSSEQKIQTVSPRTGTERFGQPGPSS